VVEVVCESEEDGEKVCIQTTAEYVGRVDKSFMRSNSKSSLPAVLKKRKKDHRITTVFETSLILQACVLFSLVPGSFFEFVVK
jgi:hypothetical protein